MRSLILCVLALPLFAQENYEIQVYPGESLEAGHTMIELHSNFTAQGTKTRENGVNPTQHAWHETIEITHGFTPWFETGWYIFTAVQPDGGWQWVGDHIRPRVAIPEAWNWPVGLSLSTEFGYQRRSFSTDTWTLEIRPIIDKKLGRWYLAFNPTVGKAFKGENAKLGFEFSPNFKWGYDVTPKINAGMEYYGALGPIGTFDRLRDQQQQILPAIDLNVSPKWEINFGVGVGITHGTDHLLVKAIIGYRFDR